MLRINHFALLVSLGFLTGCASSSFDVGRTETVLPLNRAWIDGKKVEYVTTDISDSAMAKSAGVNYVPRLRDAIPKDNSRSILERVYKFPSGEQISIFQSAPSPVGGDNANTDYSPLWRLVLVKWVQPKEVRELKSETELLSAEDKGDLTLTVTDIVVNCPVTKYTNGKSLQGVR